jgi:hypothetical protein
VVGTEEGRGPPQIAVARDVVPVKNGPGFVAAHLHGHALTDAGADEVSRLIASPDPPGGNVIAFDLIRLIVLDALLARHSPETSPGRPHRRSHRTARPRG